jgi:hypothetical protein
MRDTIPTGSRLETQRDAALLLYRQSSTDRLDLLRKKRDQIDAQLKALEARNKQAERKADTRRKVIAGALALEHFERNRDSEFGRTLFRLLDEYVVRPHDRALFPDLPNTQTSEHNGPKPNPGANS